MVLLITVIFITISLSPQICLGYKVSDYTLISTYLIENTSSNEPDINLDKAEEYLEHLKIYNSTSPLIDSLKVLLILRQLNDPKSCNMRGYGILKVANDLGGNKSYRKRSFESLDRLNQVLRNLGKRHAILCQDHYKAKYLERVKKLDFDYLSKVNDIGKAILNSWFYLNGDDSAAVSTLKKGNIRAVDLSSLGDPRLVPCILAQLRQIVGEYKRGYLTSYNDWFGTQVHKREVKNIMNEYVFTPCDYFTSRTSDIFKPLNYDLYFVELLQTDDDEMQSIYQKAVYSRICSMILHKKDRHTLMRQTLEAIKDDSKCNREK